MGARARPYSCAVLYTLFLAFDGLTWNDLRKAVQRGVTSAWRRPAYSVYAMLWQHQQVMMCSRRVRGTKDHVISWQLPEAGPVSIPLMNWHKLQATCSPCKARHRVHT